MTRDMRYSSEGEAFPGSERSRERYGAIPTLASELVGSVAMRSLDPSIRREGFPFRSWAVANCFKYPEEALDTLMLCESAAEAFFARGFFLLDPERRAGVKLQLQVRVTSFRIDAVILTDRVRLAIEIDGLTYHTRSKEQIAADYLRQRRIVCAGYTVIRFTAPEVFADAAECWRQVLAILAAFSSR